MPMQVVSLAGGRFEVQGNHLELHQAVLGVDMVGRYRSVSTDWVLISQRETYDEDAFGKRSCLEMNFRTPDDLQVDWVGGSYENADLFTCSMTVTNLSDKDIFLRALIPVCARSQEGGYLALSGVSSKQVRMLQNGKWMGDASSLCKTLDSRAITESYHVSALFDVDTKQGIVLGMAERTNTFTMIEASINRAGVDVALTGLLDTDLDRRPLRLKPGCSFSMNRVALMTGENIFTALDHYGSFLASYLRISPNLSRPAMGIFSVYGQEKADTDDWEKIALTDLRIDEFMDVLDRSCRKFGVNYVKTQFGGASSGPSGKDGLNLYSRHQWTKEAIFPLPNDGESLPDLIEQKGFTPDTCDLSAYHPQGVRAMCDHVHRRGYLNALVFRPYLNIRAGSEERDHLAADICKMAVEVWGYDYLMFDFIDADYENDLDDTTTVPQNITRRISFIREAVGPDVYLEGCMCMPGCLMGFVNSYRPTNDFRGGTEEELSGLLSSLYFLHGKVFALDSEFFDPDLTPFVWNGQHAPHNRIRYMGSLERVRSWITLCALMGYNLFTGGVIDDVTAKRWDIFSKALPAGHPSAVPVDLGQAASPSQWLLPLSDGAKSDCVLGLFNWDSLSQKEVQINFSNLHLDSSKEYIALSFWDEKVYRLHDGMSFTLLPSGCLDLMIRDVADEVTYLGNSRHAACQCGVDDFSWDPLTGIIRGVTVAPPCTEVTHFLFISSGRGGINSSGCTIEVEQPGVISILTKTDESGRKPWQFVLCGMYRQI